MNAQRLLRRGRKLLRVIISSTLLFALAGCETAHEYSLTYKLWDKGSRPFCRPALEPNFAVFASQTNRDVLVRYNALSEREDSIECRAYFVFTNEARIAALEKPRYVAVTLITNMSPIPVVAKTNVVMDSGMLARYPVNTDHGPGFELYRDGRSEGTHALPVYNEEKLGTASRVALTPAAVVGDTLMVAGVIATCGAVIWIQAGCPPFGHTSSGH